MTKVTIYNEYVHEQIDENVRAVYPQGIHEAIAGFLRSDDVSVRCFTLDTVEGITEEVLEDTDVIIWWGHLRHHLVPDEVAARVKDAVCKGMGAIFLHSGHHSKPFRLLMGTSCNLTWREDGDMERIWNAAPAHPIAQGIGRYFELPHVETYGEPFGIPQPDEVIFIGWYEGGEVFRSGCTFHRENGRIFYFQPGHETFPIFCDPNVQTIIRNAVNWAKPIYRIPVLEAPHVKRPGEE
ncbi:MAG: ThuA domain-containing protein [Clostridia bacterium]|nr:ThuA domain-containing protein [Clostridia bacterium]MBQ7002924.1 ThuA domain-containing protein [Oscillospiraceae bacterium]